VKEWLLKYFVETQWTVLVGAGLLIAFQIFSGRKERNFKEDQEDTEEILAPGPHSPNPGFQPNHRNRPHQILGISEYSTEEEVLAAYRKAAKKTHPDLGPQGDAIEMKHRKNAMIRLGAARDEMLERLKKPR
jgi:hypothetical protein